MRVCCPAGRAGENAGFHLWRSEFKEGPFTRITDELIPPLGGTTWGASYDWWDWGSLPASPTITGWRMWISAVGTRFTDRCGHGFATRADRLALSALLLHRIAVIPPEGTPAGVRHSLAGEI
jgi:hypothetical protein